VVHTRAWGLTNHQILNNLKLLSIWLCELQSPPKCDLYHWALQISTHRHAPVQASPQLTQSLRLPSLGTSKSITYHHTKSQTHKAGGITHPPKDRKKKTLEHPNTIFKLKRFLREGFGEEMGLGEDRNQRDRCQCIMTYGNKRSQKGYVDTDPAGGRIK
jgi:hypothetical protein